MGADAARRGQLCSLPWSVWPLPSPLSTEGGGAGAGGVGWAGRGEAQSGGGGRAGQVLGCHDPVGVSTGDGDEKGQD